MSSSRVTTLKIYDFSIWSGAVSADLVDRWVTHHEDWMRIADVAALVPEARRDGL